MPAARRRRDGQPTAEELQRQSEQDCPGHVASDADPKVCRHCGVHIDDLRPPDDDGVDDLASILPPGEGQPIAEAVAEAQAAAVADSAPVRIEGHSEQEERDNRIARYEIVKAKFARLDEIAVEKKELADEEEEIRTSLEKESGYQRTAVAAVRKVKNLGSAAAMQKHIDNRTELEAIFIKPILDAAAAGQTDE